MSYLDNVDTPCFLGYSGQGRRRARSQAADSPSTFDSSDIYTSTEDVADFPLNKAAERTTPRRNLPLERIHLDCCDIIDMNR